MIDPKFNELPGKKTGDVDVVDDEATLTGDGRASTTGSRSGGLSIHDTIAENANMSVGSRGTDTSGVKAGAGVGGGQSQLTPAARGESPSPNLVPGARGSGTTVRGEGGTDEHATIHRQEAPTETSAASESHGRAETGAAEFYTSSSDTYPSHEEISAHAYRCWHERGCPSDSPEDDWHRAENELKNRARATKTQSASV